MLQLRGENTLQESVGATAFLVQNLHRPPKNKFSKEDSSLLPGRNSHIVLFARVIKLSEAPVNEPKFALFMVNHYIVGLHISVHYSL